MSINLEVTSPSTAKPWHATTYAPSKSFLKDPQFQADLQRLRLPDNRTNFYHLAATWLKVALVLTVALWFLVWRAEAGWHWAIDVPVALAAIGVIGALQHQLAALGHEASHFALFRNRKLNELMGDVFCFYPLFSSTQVYRLQHLEHHKWVNHPEHDPDLRQLLHSGHKFDFPKTPREVYVLLLRQLLPTNQMRYSLGRIKHLAQQEAAARNTDTARESRIIPVLFIGSLLTMIGLLAGVSYAGETTTRIALPAAFTVGMLTTIILLPERLFGPRIARSPIPLPLAGTFKVAVFFIQFTAVAAIGWWLGPRMSAYLAVLWIVPLLTTFSLFNMIRQTLHHANTDSGWLSNSRNFFVGPVLRSAVFPFGQEMHLIHHMFSSVPHYNLKPLHDRLMQFAEYRHQAIQVEGWLHHDRTQFENPSVVDVLGPEYTPKQESEPFVDYSVDAA